MTEIECPQCLGYAYPDDNYETVFRCYSCGWLGSDPNIQEVKDVE